MDRKELQEILDDIQYDDFYQESFEASKDYKILVDELNYADRCHKLEEQLGCPLEVVFKAIKNGIYYENNTRKIIYIRVYFTTNSYKTEFVLRDLNDDYALLSRNYKKTWWLKEDRSE